MTAPLRAQRAADDTLSAGRRAATPLEATAGSELEKYMRALQLVGAVSDRSVTIRGYAPRTLETIRSAGPHPWHRFVFAPVSTTGSRLRVDVLPIRTWSVFNQAFPFSYGDAAVWSGRGLTSAVAAGIAGRAGPITFVLQPVAFRAANRPFALAPVAGALNSPFADASEPGLIDMPQRFGDGTYQRVDPGQSTIRVDLGPLAAGVSTAAESWGPGLVHPLLMGLNAPGFRHLFVGTSGARSVGVGRVDVELILGRPVDSPYAPTTSSRRYIAGGVVSFQPRWIPGLEIGGGRVFHRPVPDGGVPLVKVFSVVESFFQSASAMARKNLSTDPNYSPDNQLASAFVSWGHPASGLRLYGEILKNDNNLNVRELATEPDHDAAILLGVERAVRRAADGSTLVVMRVESVDARITHIARVREQATSYEHGQIVQGHTNRGQVLGSTAVQGGGGQHAAADWYTRGGRISLLGDRIVRRSPQTEGADADHLDVQLAAGLEAVRFSRGFDWFGRARVVRELNRDYGGDATSLQLLAGVSWRPNVHVRLRGGPASPPPK